MKRAFLLAALVLVAFGCDNADQPQPTEDPAFVAPAGVVIATTPVLADVARALMEGTGVEVMQSGDVTNFERAAVVLAEAPTADYAQDTSLSTFVPAERRVEGNAHAYGDVGLFAEFVVPGMERALAEAYPQQASKIGLNASAYQQKLAQLDDYARRTLARVPESNRRFASNLPMSAYLARAYGLSVEPGAGHDSELLVDPPAPAGTFEATYLGLMDHVVTYLATELGAPGVDSHGTFGKLTLGHDHEHDH